MLGARTSSKRIFPFIVIGADCLDNNQCFSFLFRGAGMTPLLLISISAWKTNAEKMQGLMSSSTPLLAQEERLAFSLVIQI